MSKTFRELVAEMDQLGMKIRMHVMKIPLHDRDKHAMKLCDECRPWFLRKTEVAKELFLVRQQTPKPVETPLPPSEGLLPPKLFQ